MPRRDEPGGRRIHVQIVENGIIVFSRSAVLNQQLGGGTTRWKTDDGDRFTMPRTATSADLAAALMRPRGSRNQSGGGGNPNSR